MDKLEKENKKKILIEVDALLLKRIDAIKDKKKISRRKIFEFALKQFLESYKDD